jgi:alkylation response protein AidB-like acyl-CoA dehydrogenase
VDFDLNEDQLALREGARDLLDGLSSPTSVRVVVEAGGGLDAKLWGALVEQGWLGVDVPEDEGGLGLGPIETAVLLEEIGHHAAPVPFTATVLALAAVRAAGETEWRDRILNGDVIGTVAWSRDPGAVRADAAGNLTGRADPTPFAPSADVAIVFALDADGETGLYLVALSEAERPPAEAAMDQTRELGWLRFADTPAQRIGGAEAAAALLDRAAIYTSAEMLGGADRALAMAVEYAKDRIQFDRPIGSFQAVKHRCADMLVDVEGMRSTVYWAAWCLAADDPELSVAASTAKVWGADASKRVMASALQVHGGIGFTWEHDLHLFLKRAQLDQRVFGDATVHRDRLAALLTPRVAAGESVI